MKLRKVAVSAVMALAAIGFAPAGAQAASCLPSSTEKFIGRTCWDCGWIMIRGEGHVLFYCD